MNDWAASLTTSQLVREIVRAEIILARANEGEGLTGYERSAIADQLYACSRELDSRVPGNP